MTERQRKFVDEYILTGNATEAARRAGYSERYANRQAHRLLNFPEVRTALAKQLEAARTEKTLDERALLEFLSRVVLGEVTDEALMAKLVGHGRQEIERHEVRASTKDRLRAAELLLKVHGASREKIDVKVDTSTLFVEALEKVWSDEETA